VDLDQGQCGLLHLGNGWYCDIEAVSQKLPSSQLTLKRIGLSDEIESFRLHDFRHNFAAAATPQNLRQIRLHPTSRARCSAYDGGVGERSGAVLYNFTFLTWFVFRLKK